VLVLAGIEIIFFIVSSMGSCFGFVLKTVSMTQGCFCHYQVKAFSAPHTTPPASGLGVHKKLGGDTAGTTDQKDSPYCMTSCSAFKAGGRRRKGGKFGVMVFVSPSNHYL